MGLTDLQRDAERLLKLNFPTQVDGAGAEAGRS
jgi:hypothetical protein